MSQGMIILHLCIVHKEQVVICFSKCKKKDHDAVNIIAFLYKTPFGVLGTDKSGDALWASSGRKPFRSYQLLEGYLCLIYHITLLKSSNYFLK